MQDFLGPIYLIFCKLDRFSTKENYCTVMKQTIFQKSVSKFAPKKFLGFCPGACTINIVMLLAS
jgi:hypothetical protein